MDIGSMRRRLLIEKHETVIDKIGNHTSKWTDFHSCFCYANLSSGDEYGVSPETIEQGSVTFIIRWAKKLAGLNSKEYRIRFQGEAYNIVSVDDVQFRHEKLQIIAEIIPRGDRT
ncbi:hypothetical protein BHK98_02580 [Hornefia porci]|uniref:Head-tail adaptor protein n=1 Tax=Hornefia porci TaxID=2652292 RepID=A0A1Q9JFT2_9FIRM|nr:phage head closure protein [Hornefia porci]OLR55049.1 hypothetical protein BHK98_02580 [Hornefia porci]